MLIAAANALAPRADAATVAANGFTSAANGYSFPNYGNDPGVTDLTVEDMRRLFGDRVCSNKQGADGCTLIPEARAWMEAESSAMKGGHCFGMASSSQLFFEHKGDFPDPSAFGASTTPALAFDTPKLQAWIAYLWTLQSIPAVSNAKTDLDPAGVVKQLEDTLKPGEAPYVLTIYGQGDGHAITPIGVEDDGNGQRRIAVYDNNWPGETRYVHVDTNANTWFYELAPGLTWRGTSKTKSLELANPSLGLGHQPCFICAAKNGTSSAGRTVQLQLTGDDRKGQHGPLTVTDQRGERAGFRSTGTFNDIHGAKLVQPTTGPPFDQPAPASIDLPTRNSYTVQLKPSKGAKRLSEDVRLIGRGFSVGADDVQVRKGQHDEIKIERRARNVSFLNDQHGVESPSIVVTASNLKGGADYQLTFTPDGVDPNAGISARFNSRTQSVRVTNDGGSKIERVEVDALIYTAKGTEPGNETLKIRRNGGKTIKLSDL